MDGERLLVRDTFKRKAFSTYEEFEKEFLVPLNGLPTTHLKNLVGFKEAEWTWEKGIQLIRVQCKYCKFAFHFTDQEDQGGRKIKLH